MEQASTNRRTKIPNQRSWTPKYIDLTVEESKDNTIRDERMRANGMDPSKRVLLREHRKGVTVVQWVENGPCRFNQVTSGITTVEATGSASPQMA